MSQSTLYSKESRERGALLVVVVAPTGSHARASTFRERLVVIRRTVPFKRRITGANTRSTVSRKYMALFPCRRVENLLYEVKYGINTYGSEKHNHRNGE